MWEVKSKLLFCLGLILLIVVSSCSKSFKSESELLKWISEEDNGLVKTKKVGALNVKVKYIPQEYLAYKEYAASSKTLNSDSLKKYYEHSLTFLLTISPEKSMSKEDLIKGNVTNMEEYKEKIMEMNFNMSEYLELKLGDKVISPVLARVEDTYGLQKHRNINVIYEIPKGVDISKTDLDFVFDDMVFNTGINHFKFEGEDIANIPVIKFW